jgi:hypothetical protein
MRNLALVYCTLALLSFAAPAFAQADNQTTNDDPCQGTMNIDTCMWSDSNPASGGNYLSCTAVGSQNQGCQSVTKDQALGTVACSTVYYSAKCNCDPRTLSATGTCTYQAR